MKAVDAAAAKRVGASLGVVASMIIGFEAYRSTPYLDSAGLPTVCVGHMDRKIDMRREYTEGECAALFKADLAITEAAIAAYVNVPLTANQRAALQSFIFNVGAEAFRTSTLLRKLNAGDYAGAAKQFDRWILADGVKVQGLVNRRAAERELFETP